jgi:hypothetical protein
MRFHDVRNQTAFIIGNGRSRESIQLDKLEGVTIGCNALYRDFFPTCLFAIDGRMVKEIKESTFPNERFWARSGRTTKMNEIKYKGSNSGVVAFRHAVNWGFGRIVMLGIDLRSDATGAVNNIYTGSNNYPKETVKSPKFQRWITQYESALKEAKPYQQFERIIHPTHSNLLEEWTIKYNLKNIPVEKFTANLA